MKSRIVSLLLALAVVLPSLFLVFETEQVKEDYIQLNKSKIAKVANLEGTSGGTGFYITAPSGKVFVMTNAHVCEVADKNYVFIDTGTDVFASTIEHISQETDLCLVKAPYNAKGLRLASDTRDGEIIYTLGHPLLEPKSLTRGQLAGRVVMEVLFGIDIPCEGPGFRKVEAGLLEQIFLGAKYLCIRQLEANPITANILPGNSGSPVFNQYGNVVGVVFAGREGSGRGYIIPLDYVKRFLEGK